VKGAPVREGLQALAGQQVCVVRRTDHWDGLPELRVHATHQFLQSRSAQ